MFSVNFRCVCSLQSLTHTYSSGAEGMSLLMLAELSACTGFLLLKSTLQDPVVGLSGVKISSYSRLMHIQVSC